MEQIINKVAQSGLITFNLEDYYDKNERVVFDIKECLYMGLILREKDFREFVKTNNWEQYRDKNLAITCSADAIVPTWAYMLIASKLSGIANYYFFGIKSISAIIFSMVRPLKLGCTIPQLSKASIFICPSSGSMASAC